MEMLYSGWEKCGGAAVSAILLLYLLTRQKRLCFNKDIIALSSAGFAAAAVVSLFFALDKSAALPGTLHAAGGFLFYTFCIGCKAADDKGFERRALIVLVYLGFALALGGILLSFSTAMGEFVLTEGRLAAFIRYPNTFGVFVLVCIVLSCDLRKGFREMVFIQAILWAALVLSFSRGCYFLSAAAFPFMLFINRGAIKQCIVSAVFGTGLGILLSFGTPFISFVNRAGEMSPQVTEFQERLFYYKDAVRMIAEHPFGTGAGGNWLLQGQYQTGLYYDIPYLHNGILQIASDFGILAVLLFSIAAAAYFLRRKRLSNNKLACFIIFAHGMIDFDWQFNLIFYMIFLFFALEAKNVREIPLARVGKVLIKGFLASAAVICIWGFSYTAAGAGRYYDWAVKINPHDTKSLTALDDFTAAKRYSSYMDEKVYAASYLHNRKNNPDQALADLERLTELRPLMVQFQEEKGRLLIELAEYAYRDGSFDNAMGYLDEIFEIEEEITAAAVGIDPKAYQLKHKPELKMTEKLKRCQSTAEKLRKEIKAQEDQEQNS